MHEDKPMPTDRTGFNGWIALGFCLAGVPAGVIVGIAFHWVGLDTRTAGMIGYAVFMLCQLLAVMTGLRGFGSTQGKFATGLAALQATGSLVLLA